MFTPAERDIFAYQAAGAPKFGDPMAIDRRLFRGLVDHDIEAIDKALEGDNEAAYWGAIEKLLPAAREAFRLQAFDEDTGAGSTDGETLDVLIAFLAWKSQKKVTGENGPNSSEPTDFPPGEPTTSSSTLDCG